MHEFLEILKLEAQEILTKFARSSIEGRGTSQEISDFREHAVQDFVRRYYPFPYQIGKGGIIDSYGRRSNSIDCIILNPNHPHTVNIQGKHSLIMADGVDVAIEVKPKISVKSELERALHQGITVKELRRRSSNLVFEKSEHLLEYAKQIPYFIFAIEAKSNIEDTIKEIKAFYNEKGTPTIDQADVIVILNKGIIVNYKYAELNYWDANLTPEEKGSWIYEAWSENSLAGFLFHLNRVYGASVVVSEPFLDHYLLEGSTPIKSFL